MVLRVICPGPSMIRGGWLADKRKRRDLTGKCRQLLERLAACPPVHDDYVQSGRE